MLRILIALFVVSLIAPALAHMHDRPDLDHWLQTLYSRDRGSCCDSTEAETMADPDWRTASEMHDGKDCTESDIGASDADHKVAYCVRLENPAVPGEWKWWTVPASGVVEMSANKAGPALLWWYPTNAGPNFKPYIRCFLPGGGV